MLGDVDPERGRDGSRAPEDLVVAAPEPEPAASRLRLGWRLVVPVVTAAAGIMFAMSFQAAQGERPARRPRPPAPHHRRRRPQRGTRRRSSTPPPGGGRRTHPGQRARRTPGSSPEQPGRALAAAAATTEVRGSGHRGRPRRRRPHASTRCPTGFTADDIVVHQQDVQAVVNALWASGAEAMMIQDQRVISTSAVRCVGNTLILQGRVYAPPYRITGHRRRRLACSAASTPTRRSDVSTGTTSTRSAWAGRSRPRASVEFPAYSGSVDLDHATPIR